MSLLLALTATTNAYGVTGVTTWHDISNTGSITFGTGSLVAAIADLSGNSHNMAQATGTNQPDRNATQNGLDAATFDGVDNYMSMGAAVSVPDAGSYFFFVVKMTGSGDRTVIGAQSSHLQIRVSGGNLNVLRSDVEDCGSSSGASMDDAAWHVCSVFVSTTERRFRIDSTARGTTTVTTGGSFVDWSTLAAKEGPTELGACIIGEVLHFGSDIGTGNRDIIESALTAKWFGSGTVNATIAYTEDDDSWVVAAAETIGSTIAWTEDDDTIVAAMAETITSTTAWTEDDDVWALAMAEAINATIAYTEDDDVWTVAAAEAITSTIAWTEDDDVWVIAAANTAPGDCTIAYTEDDDVWALAAAENIASSIAYTEDDDVWVIAMAEAITISVAYTEADDTIAAAALETITATIAWTEDDDLWVLAMATTAGGTGPTIPGETLTWREPSIYVYAEPGTPTWREAATLTNTEPDAYTWREPPTTGGN